MKTLTVRLPHALIAEIEREAQARRVSKSDVLRDRLQQPRRNNVSGTTMMDVAGDLIGSIKGLPRDLSTHKKRYLAALIRDKKLHRR